MSNSVSEELVVVKELINKGKMEEALQLVKDIEQKKTLAPKENLRILAHKAFIYSYLGQFEISFEISEELYEKSQETKMTLFSLDALFLKELILIVTGRFEEYYKICELHENLFHSLPREAVPEYQEREIKFLIMRANLNFYNSNLDPALEDYEKSLALIEKVDLHSFHIYTIMVMIAYTYQVKGELQLSLEYSEKALSLIPKEEYYLPMTTKADTYRSMGGIYNAKGDSNRALDYHKFALEIYEKFPVGWRIAWSYSNIISILFFTKNTAQAQAYLQKFKQITENSGSKINVLMYQLSLAQSLRASSIRRDQLEAINIMKNIAKEESNPYMWQRNLALSSLCWWYFEEFQLTNKMEILNDIQLVLDQLEKGTLQLNSYESLAQVKLYQAKLALLQINMVDARKLLTEAQQIADEHGLQNLAGAISREHDKLLEELKLWESIKKTKVTVSERLELASVDDVLERMQGRRATEPLELTNEEPILILIMDKSGVPYFNHSFGSEWDIDGIFSAFMSAFNAFSSELFSRSIDRIKIGDNTILIKLIEPYFACYVIKGQSYPAQQKLTRFSDTIKATSEIWTALNRAAKTSEMLELDNPSSLGNAVNEIFIN